MRKLLYAEFAREVEEAGLIARHCSLGHWQIRGGEHHRLVNVWPNGKRGFGMATDNGRRQAGSIRAAIALAGPPRIHTGFNIDEHDLPWEEKQRVPTPQRVGLIRWLWKWIW